MRTPLIISLLLSGVVQCCAADSPRIEIVPPSKQGMSKITVFNPTDSPIYFLAPPGQDPESIELLVHSKWVPEQQLWCGTGYDFVRLRAGGSISFERFIPTRKRKLRFHIWYVPRQGYRKIRAGHPEGVPHHDIYSSVVDA